MLRLKSYYPHKGTRPLKLPKLSLHTIIFFSLPIFFTLANSPQRGSSEGGQGNASKISDKVDFWGSILPIITLDNSVRSSIFLSVLSLSIYWSGFVLAVFSEKPTNLKLILLTFLGSLGAIFSQQNLRDAFLLSFAMLSLGFVEKLRSSKIKGFRYLFLVPLIFTVSFKYPTSIAIVFLILFRFYASVPPLNLKKFSLILFTSSLVVVSGVSLDKGLAKAGALVQGYVEQSVIYYDLASFYCWSDDTRTRNLAIEALSPLLITQDPKEICLTHRPNAWIYLVSGGNFIDQGVIAPLRQLAGANDSNYAKLLQTQWIKTIKSDPVDYIQIKLIAATQVITVGNPFIFAQPNFTNKKFPDSISDYLWSPISRILIFIGNSYLFSIFILILILLTLLYLGGSDSKNRFLIITVLFIQVVNIIVLSTFYVSDEARYIFPIIVISYLILIKDFKVPRITDRQL